MNSRNQVRNVVAATIALLLPLAGGCTWTPELSQIKQDIARQIPDATFDHQISLAIGPGGMALTRAAMSFVPGARDVRGWLKDVDCVQVSVYDVRERKRNTRVTTPERIEKMMDEGWEMAARVHDDGESAWVLYRIADDSIREVFVAAFDRDELVLVKVKGKCLERLLARALSDADGRRDLGRSFHHDS